MFWDRIQSISRTWSLYVFDTLLAYVSLISIIVFFLTKGSIRVTTGSGNITSKSIKGNYISLLSQTGNINCVTLSQGRIVVQSGSGV